MIIEVDKEGSMEAFEWIPISMLNAYAYCPRRFYYEFAQAEMVVNEHVLEGQQLHERVDLSGSMARGEKVQMRHLYVCAPGLGLTGYCDLVETIGETANLALLAEAHKLYPVEYKKGKMGKWISDHTQLCAQALALEEVLQVTPGSIERGYVYYIGSSRRDEVALDETLREQTLTAIAEARRLAESDTPPEPICLPREILALHMKKEER
jgi:CRISPR-associated exonuclease Cas4